ncbi:MAG: DUF7657 domain-containing protein [Arenicellales bacterium]|nr:hypothetical protein [Gammaproteobacteria bacterium]
MAPFDLKKFIRSNVGNAVAISVLSLLALVYAGQNWTPSSYGWALKHYFGASDTGLISGIPRAERSDEWAIATALTQATVNNDFERFNQTSIYNEDLRSVFSMPIRDWGLFFKPGMWGYLFLPPHKAFSVYHVSFIFLFLAGYALLFQRFGLPIIASYLLSGTVFFTGYMQFWWTTFGQLASFFPWLLLVLLDGARHPKSRALAFWWLASATMLSAHFYPPLFIQFAFVGLIFLLVLRARIFNLQFIVWFGMAGGAALLTMYLYLRDPLLAMQATIYPGQRISSGGGEGLRMTLSQFFPLLNLHEFRPLIRPNIPESGVIGSLFFLPLLVFLNYRASLLSNNRIPVASLGALLLGLFAVYMWMFVDVPSWLGRIFLWTRVDPHRMYFASGMLTLGIALMLFTKGLFTLNLRRWIILIALNAGVLYYYKLETDELAFEQVFVELAFLALFLIPCMLSVHLRNMSFRITLLIASAGYGAWAFSGYNPIQSSTAIFARKATGVTQALDALVEQAGGRDVLNVPDFPGATLNGWGYPATSHTLLTPQMDFWKKTFPDLPAEKRQALFNRYANVQVSSAVSKPVLVRADNVWVPVESFSSILENPRTLSWATKPSTTYLKTLGSIDSLKCEEDELTLSGWAWWHGKDSEQHLTIVSDRTVRESEFKIRLRYDVASALGEPTLARGGFIIRARLSESCGLEPIALCAISTDASGIRYRLDNSNAQQCPE